MSLNMYLGEVQAQTESMNSLCTATIQGIEQIIHSIDAFALDTVLQGQTYSSAKAYFLQTFSPLAQGIIYLCEELIRQNDAFPRDFQSQVASTDVIEQEILEQIREIDRMIASTETINQAMPISGMDAIVNLFADMRRKLQEKLEHLYEFNQTSSDNYNTAIQLAASITTGLAEVRSGKGFSPASGTFSTQGLNMEWTASIQAITEEKNRQADNSIEDRNLVKIDTANNIPPTSKETTNDLKKAARDLTGELSGEYDVRRVMEGVDPDTGKKLSWLERTGAGVMVFAGLTPVEKGIKLLKGGKKVFTATKNLLRSDDYLRSIKNAKGIKKSYINESGNLIPANKEGMYKGRQVTVTEHILGGYRKGAKNNSPYTSFSPNNGATVKYGDNSIELDFNALRTAIRNGDIKDVAILKPKQIERLIEQDRLTTPHWKKLALKWTKRDNEYLIKGEIPKDYFRIHE
ncbi:pre-toxin TG domain-containing protein [Bacillus luti]|uniref:pre-toxin TG domain-containing protein n=1 Tax=Bacillus luti TaxID=2026191 RepID=UPI003D074ADD